MIGVGLRPFCFSKERISSVASRPPITGIDTSIYDLISTTQPNAIKIFKSYQNDIEGLSLCNAALEHLERHASVLDDLNSMPPVMLEDLTGNALGNNVIVSKQDVI
jgi:hypothetical protein